MSKEEMDLIIAEQNKSTEEILKVIANIKALANKLCNSKDIRIAELEVTNKKISDECHKLVDTLEKKQNEIAELEAQIEKMKRCYNCKYHNKFVESKCGECEVYSKWEIEEK